MTSLADCLYNENVWDTVCFCEVQFFKRFPFYHRKTAATTQWQTLQPSHKHKHRANIHQRPLQQMWWTAEPLWWHPMFSLSWEPVACRDCLCKRSSAGEPDTELYLASNRPPCHYLLIFFSSSQKAIKRNNNQTLCPVSCWWPHHDARSMSSAYAQRGVRLGLGWFVTVSECTPAMRNSLGGIREIRN